MGGTHINESKQYSNITSTTTVSGHPCEFLGIFVASASATPTIKVQDGVTTVVNTFTPAGATFYPIPARIGTSLVITISGTVDCTVFYAG